MFLCLLNFIVLDLSELGQSCKLCCELSARVKPTLSDVKVALIDMGMLNYFILIQHKWCTEVRHK